jgi:hypothetical protein
MSALTLGKSSYRNVAFDRVPRPLHAGSRKPLILYGGKWAIQVFRNQVIVGMLLHKAILLTDWRSRRLLGILVVHGLCDGAY